MKYFITGKGGFIGRNIVKYVGEVNVVNQFENGCAVIHLSAYGNHHFQTDVEKIIQANITDLIHLVNEAFIFNVSKFYNFSTSSVTLPVQTMYSASKLFGETLINSINDERFVNIRPYSVYGIGEAEHRFIPTVIRHLYSGEKMQLDPLPKHDWIFCDDFIQAMFLGHKYIGTGLGYSNLQIVEMLQDISGKKLNYEEKKLRVYDNFNWVCKQGVPHRFIYEGLKKTYESFRKKDC